MFTAHCTCTSSCIVSQLDQVKTHLLQQSLSKSKPGKALHDKIDRASAKNKPEAGRQPNINANATTILHDKVFDSDRSLHVA